MSYSFLGQTYTWSRPQICEGHFRKLFTCLKVQPSFLDIVHVFCEKVGPVEDRFFSEEGDVRNQTTWKGKKWGRLSEFFRLRNSSEINCRSSLKLFPSSPGVLLYNTEAS